MRGRSLGEENLAKEMNLGSSLGWVSISLMRERGETHVNSSLHASLNTSTLESGSDLSNDLVRPGDFSRLDQLRDAAGVLELVLYALGAAHGHGDGDVGEAVLDGELDAVGLDVGDDDALRVPQHAAGVGAAQAHGASAEDQDGRLGGGLGSEVGARVGVEGDGEGLDEGALLEGDGRGKLVTPAGRVVDALLECALGMGESLCRGAEVHAPADVVAAGLAIGAVLTGQADLEGDAVADLDAIGVGADGGDGAGGLVAEGHGLADEDVAVAVVAVVVQVGAAEPRGLHGDLDLAGRGRVEGAGLDAEVFGPVEDRRLDCSHCGGGCDVGDCEGLVLAGKGFKEKMKSDAVMQRLCSPRLYS